MLKALRTLSIEVLVFVERKVGAKLFFAKRAEVERHVAKVRDERRRHERIQAVANPSEYARRKIKENLAKREELSKRRVKMRTIRAKNIE